MAVFKEAGLDDRKNAAAEAKKAMLEKFKSRPSTDDPAVQARLAERKALAEAREQRIAERNAAKAAAAEAARIEREAFEAAERIRLAEEAEAERIRVTAEFVANQERDASLKAEQKAKRDARYAARKARR